MSYKTNPTVNRIKHTMGWQQLVKSTAPRRHMILKNLQTYRLFIFFKNWFKFRSWFLLNLEQVSTNNTQIWFITAARISKKNRPTNRPIKNFYDYPYVGAAAKKSLHYKKKTILVAKHYRLRKKMFKFTQLYRNVSIFNKKFNWELKKKSVEKEVSTFFLAKRKKNNLTAWLKLLTNVTQHSLFSKTLQTRYDLREKLLSANLLHFENSLKGYLFWPTRKWRGYKKLEKFPKKLLTSPVKNIHKTFQLRNHTCFVKNILFNKNRTTFVKKSVILKKKLRYHRIFYRMMKILTYIKFKNRQKNNFGKNRSYALFTKTYFLKHWLKNSVKYSTFTETKRIETAFIKWQKAKITNNSLKNTKIFSLKRLRFFHKKQLKFLQTKKNFYGNLYAFWKGTYIKKLMTKEITVQNFLKLFKILKNRRQIMKAGYKYWLVLKKMKKMRLYKSSLFFKTNKKIFWLLDRNENKKLRRLRLPYNRPSLSFKKHLNDVEKWKPNRLFSSYVKDSMVQNIWQHYNWNFSKLLKIKRATLFYAKKQQQQKTINTQQIKLNAIRLNFIFKKVLSHVFNESNGSCVVKILQPTTALLSIKKFRSVASKSTVIRMYKKQKLYRRILRILVLFFRYWHPQPIIEQIAFELEKTKKHWPILKTIRALLGELTPRQWQGYRILIRGKINSADRTRGFFIKHGKEAPTSTFNSRMLYGAWQSLARTGVFTIRGWIYLPQQQQQFHV
jgi:hypothetical protein